ncbi:hypothetical protein KBD45_06270 [Candidatus Dojkabacteria bacterium]|nr:hypothetical protein [Candidatus Dojkabacteria bacterium]
MFQHKYFENVDENTIKRHLDFALNNIDQLLYINNPQEKQNFISQYFVALATLIIIFNDRQTDLDLLLGMSIDSSKLLNVLQKISFYKELRESPFLIQFQRQLNLFLETYPNEVTNQFLHIVPIEPVKFDKKKSRKEIIYKLFRKRSRKGEASQIQPAVRIGEYTSTPKLYNDKEHIKTDKSRFLSRLFRTSDDSQPEVDKAKARAAFEKVQNRPASLINSAQDQSIKLAEKEREDRILNQKITQQRRSEIKAQPIDNNNIDKLKIFNAKQNLLTKIKNLNKKTFLNQKEEKFVLPIIKGKTEKTKNYELKHEEGWTFMDSLKLHQNNIPEQTNNIKNTKNRKIESYQDFKEQNKSSLEKFIDKLFSIKNKPIYSAQQLEKIKAEAANRSESEIEQIMKGKQKNESLQANSQEKEKKINSKSFFYKTFREILILKNRINDFFYRNSIYKKLEDKKKVKQGGQETSRTESKNIIKSPVSLDQKIVSQQAQDAIKAIDAQSTKDEIIRNLVTQSKLKREPTSTILNSEDMKNITKDPDIIKETNKTFENSEKHEQELNNKKQITIERAHKNNSNFIFLDKLFNLIKSLFKPKAKLANPKTINYAKQTTQESEIKQEQPNTLIKRDQLNKAVINIQKAESQQKNTINIKPATQNIIINKQVVNAQSEKGKVTVPDMANPLLKLLNSSYAEFQKSVPIVKNYPGEFAEELMFELEKKIGINQNDMFLNFENLDTSLVSMIITTHAKYLSKKIDFSSNINKVIIGKYNLLTEYIDYIYKVNRLKNKYSNVDKIYDFVLSQYIAFCFRQNLFGKHLAEYQLEKVYSSAEIKLNGHNGKEINEVPRKIFQIEDAIMKNSDNTIDLEQTIDKESRTFEMTILLTIHNYIEQFSDSLSRYLKEESKKNLYFLINSRLRLSLTHLASEIFLTTYALNIYKNLEQGNLRRIKVHMEKELKKTANEFLSIGVSESDKFGLFSDLYFKLYSIFSETSNIPRKEIDSFIEEIIKAVCFEIIEWRVIPRNFYNLNIREALVDEKIYFEINHAVDVYLIPETQEDFQFEEYFETYIFSYTQDSREKIYSLSSTVRNNPDYIKKIINIAYDKSMIKEKLTDITYKLKYDINKDISLAKDLI